MRIFTNCHCYFVFAFLLTATNVPAGPVGQKDALAKAAAFASRKGSAVDTSPGTVRKAKKMSAAGTPCYYVFNMAAGRGFVVVSGDDRTTSILGYTDNGSFDEATAPDNLKAWLSSYADQIAALDSHPIPAATAGPTEPGHPYPSMEAILPLLSCTWNQGAPYNNFCPVINGARCPSGCVATAMAQVMYHNKWPQDLTTAIPSWSFNSMALPGLPAVKFDWDNMRDSYGSDAAGTPATAIATLMQYCGQAIRTVYTPEGSSASYGNVFTALKKYFGYDKNVKHLYRSNYTIAGWASIIYNELANNRPVMYAGTASGGAHAFVCDGYDGDGLFHINWGWGGMADGYFKLSVLNPGDNSGIGASSSSDGYSMWQDILIGIQRPTGSPEEPEILKLNITGLHVSGDAVIFDYWNNLTDGTYKFDYGLGILNDDGTIAGTINGTIFTTGNLPPHSGSTGNTRRLKGKLGEGTYKVVPISRVNGTETWYSSSTINYVEAVVAADKSVTLTLHPVLNVTGCKFYLPGNHVAGKKQNVGFTVTNGGDEMNHVAYLFASTTADKGSPLNRTALVVEAGGQSTQTLYFTPTAAGNHRIWIALDDKGNNVIGDTTMVVMDATKTEAKLSMLGAYTIEKGKPTNITLTLKNNGSENYINNFVVHLWKGRGNGSYGLAGTQVIGDLNIAPDSVKTLTVTVPTNENGNYMVSLHYYKMFSSTDMTEIPYGGNFNSDRWFAISDADGIVYDEDLTDNGGIITASHNLLYKSSEGIAYVIDNRPATKFCTGISAGDKIWLRYDSPDSIAVTSYKLTSANDAQERDPRTWQLQGSNDGSEWTTLDSRSGEIFSSRHQQRTYTVDNADAYKYHRLYITALYNPSATIFQLAEWQLYGNTTTGIEAVETSRKASGKDIYVTDLAGNIRLHVPAADRQPRLSLDALPRGCYIVREGSKVYKAVKH